MPATVLYMSMSLDGYIAGLNDAPENPGGDGFDRLHDWINDSPVAKDLIGEMTSTGAVLVGRRTAEQVDYYGGDHHAGVPMFVLSHESPGQNVANYPLVTYVDGIESAVEQAKAAAGEKDVLVHGAYTAQRALDAGLLDEIQIHLVPVLFGAGLRQFDVLAQRVELEVLRVIDTPDATHIRYRVAR